MTKTWKVYVAHDATNGVVYVGQTSQPLEYRVRGHKGSSRNCQTKMAIHTKRYEIDCFTWSVVFECDSKEEAVAVESELTEWYMNVCGRDCVLNESIGTKPGESRKEKSATRKRATAQQAPRMKDAMRRKQEERSAYVAKGGSVECCLLLL